MHQYGLHAPDDLAYQNCSRRRRHSNDQRQFHALEDKGFQRMVPEAG
jgi:hypothetical protein